MRIVGAVSISEDAFFAGCLVCPNCGDSKFGSTQYPDGSLVRSCHGLVNDETPCAFQWPSTDDHKYFHLPLSFVLARNASI